MKLLGEDGGKAGAGGAGGAGGGGAGAGGAGGGHSLDIKAKVLDQHKIKNIAPVKSISDVESISKIEEIIPIDDDLALKLKAEVVKVFTHGKVSIEAPHPPTPPP